MRFRPSLLRLVASSLVLGAPLSAGADVEWQATAGTVTLSLPPAHLESLGLSVWGVRETAPSGSGPGVYSFATTPGFALDFRMRAGGFGDFAEPPAVVSVSGGLGLRARDPRSGAPLSSVALFDFDVEIRAGHGPDFAQLRTTQPDLPIPLRVRNGGVDFAPGSRELAVRLADVVISREWANALGWPGLEGQWIGTLELRLAAVPASNVPLKTLDLAPPKGPREPTLDVMLGELYDLVSLGRLGDYPNGWSGLSATTTSCNNGTVDVPWEFGQTPMLPSHPGIGLALFREKDGRLEMLGKNWLKHGFLAVAFDQCDLGCPGGPAGFALRVACSDTYTAGNNGGRLYLGPREEFNPHTGAWEPCGSFFDGDPADCDRSYFGFEEDEVVHRIEIPDSDLGDPDARYFYEGCYYVAGDDSLYNNIGWRECTTEWNGVTWRFPTFGMPLQLEPNPGPVVMQWGDTHDTKAVARDDGLVILATQVTQPDSEWRYEYALYNRSSDRGVHSFSLPIGSANVSQVGFRDADRDPANDWTVTIADGMVTWSTADHATDPDAPALFYQTLFNFWFVADRPPVSSSATGGIFKPGVGTSVFLDTSAPAAALPGEPGRNGPVAIGLSSLEPNPFSRGTALRFSLPRSGPVRVSVVDVTGRVVQILAEDTAPAGPAVIRWDGRDSSGQPAANGVYFFRLESEHGTRVTKGTLLR